MSETEKPVKYAWFPQIGPQSDAISAVFISEILYGGAVGGGKTDFLIGDFLQSVNQGYGRAWKGIIFRKTYPELSEILDRTQEIFPLLGAKFNEKEYLWRFPCGETLKLAHLDHERDYRKYHGKSYTWIGWDELTLWATDVAYKKMITRLRSKDKEAAKVKRIRSTTNPTGAGHHWVYQRFVQDEPNGYKITEHGTMTRVFIPSKLKDNVILTTADPDYEEQLDQSGSPEFVRAMKEGDWNVISGAYFPEIARDKHIIEPFALPKELIKIGGFDWGYSKPYAMVWGAISDGNQTAKTVTGKQFRIPRNSLIIYRELYGWNGVDINTGAKESNPKIAKKIASYNEKLVSIQADPSIFDASSGEAIVEDYEAKGLPMEPADNARVTGWSQIRKRANNEKEEPGIYFFSTCPHLIRSLSTLQHDDRNPEDCDSSGDDHLPDALRYLAMEVILAEPEKYDPVDDRTPLHFGDILKARKIRIAKRPRDV